MYELLSLLQLGLIFYVLGLAELFMPTLQIHNYVSVLIIIVFSYVIELGRLATC